MNAFWWTKLCSNMSGESGRQIGTYPLNASPFALLHLSAEVFLKIKVTLFH